MKVLFSFILFLLLAPALYGSEAQVPAVQGWVILPFALLLLTIALAPFINRHWWDRYYPHVSIGLGFLVFAYYSIRFDYHRMLHTFEDYFSFIVLIGALFTVSGGIFLHTERRATPLVNTLLIAAGALMSNLVGTTGASMLIIRPFIRINKPRIRGFHVAFFIFAVSNIGGALTPIGDPPLFLGYLNGVPFPWPLLKLWPAWLFALGWILALFYLLDVYHYAIWVRQTHHPAGGTRFEVSGKRNFFFLFIVLVAVFAQTPIRELIMIAAAAASYHFAQKEALRANDFHFAPIREVAILFAGIFATMVPALDWFELNTNRLGIRTPGHFYWSSGILSSFLDNAPTYLNFLSGAMGLHDLTLGNPHHMSVLIKDHGEYLQAVSLGSVFFGACTYIGNGPNFMVKSIAEHAGVPTPTFFGYIINYTVPVLLPLFTLVWLLFF